MIGESLVPRHKTLVRYSSLRRTYWRRSQNKAKWGMWTRLFCERKDNWFFSFKRRMCACLSLSLSLRVSLCYFWCFRLRWLSLKACGAAGAGCSWGAAGQFIEHDAFLFIVVLTLSSFFNMFAKHMLLFTDRFQDSQQACCWVVQLRFHIVLCLTCRHVQRALVLGLSWHQQ